MSDRLLALRGALLGGLASWTPAAVRRQGRGGLNDFGPRSVLTGFAIVAAALLAREAIQHVYPSFPPFITLYPAVALAGLLCGPAVAAAAAALGLSIADFLWIPPRYSLLPGNVADTLALLVFVAGAALILLCGALVRASAAEAQRAKSLLDRTLGAARVGTWEVDPKTRRVAASGIAHRLHGLADTGTAGALADWLRPVHPDDLPQLRHSLESALAGAAPAQCDYRVAAATDAVRWISLRGEMVGLGSEARLLCGLTDISERVAARDAERLSEARFRAVFRQIPAAAAIISAPAAEMVLRSDRSDEILGHPAHRVTSVEEFGQYGGRHPNGRCYAAGEYPIMRALLTGEIVEAEPLIYRQPGGRELDMEVYATPIRDEAGTIIAAAGMAFDVSARKRAEDALRASEARFRTVAEAMPGLLFAVDGDGRHHYVNSRVREFLGTDEAAVVADRWMEFLHCEDRARVAGVWREAVASRRACEAEFRLRRADGAFRWVLCRAVPVASGPQGRSQWFGVAMDIEAQKQAEAALRSSREQLSEALEARDLLIREADHRIKNSLQLVISLLSVQQRHLADPQAVQALQSAVARVNAVAASHLALQNSRDLKTVAFSEVIGDLCRHFAGLSPAIDVRFHPQGDMLLDADRAIPLALVTSELLTNALRHAYAPPDTGTVAVQACEEGGDLVVTVSDDGRGMASETVGNGLGSRVVRSLMAKLGAILAIRSTPGLGTHITIRMPLTQPAAQAARPVAERQPV